MRESETKDLRDVDRAHFSVQLDAQNSRHRGEMILYGAGQPILYAPLGPAVWDYVFHDPNVWHERDDLMRLIANFELEVLGLMLVGTAEEKFTPASSGGPLLYSNTVERLW
jgi:hypothetical protein